MPDPVAPETFDIPGLGTVTRDRFSWYRSGHVFVPILDRECQIILESFVQDDCKSEFDVAIANFLSLGDAALREANEPLLRYYKDHEEWWLERGEKPLRNAEEVWARVNLGRQPLITRRPYGNRAIYVSIECECAWEEEHGLQLVFENGLRVNKLGGYDGHLTNSDAYADPQLENVIYHSLT